MTPPAGVFGKCSVVATVNGTASAPFEFTVSPYIINVSIDANDGVCTITGDHFGQTAGSVSIDGNSVSVSSWSNTKIIGVVPMSIPYQDQNRTLKVTTCGVTSEKAVAIPRMMSLAATGGKVGTTVEIRSNHFYPVLASNTVRFGRWDAEIAWASPNDSSRIVATIPSSCELDLDSGIQVIANRNGSFSAPFAITGGLARIVTKSVTITSITSALYPGRSARDVFYIGVRIVPTPGPKTTLCWGCKINGTPVRTSYYASVPGRIEITLPADLSGTCSVMVGVDVGEGANKDSVESAPFEFKTPPFIKESYVYDGVVTIRGDHFGATQGSVSFEGKSMSISQWSNTLIKGKYPTGIPWRQPNTWQNPFPLGPFETNVRFEVVTANGGRSQWTILGPL